MKNFYPFLLFIIFMCTNNLGAQPAAPDTNDYLVIKLVTIDPGAELTMWWGHTGIIVEDRRFNAATFYNYGLFSFEQDNFIANFIQGRLIFWVGAFNADAALRFYRRQNRTIRIQTLNLPLKNKIEMATLLADNVQPQNREYLYDHYYDNCATRVRDLIDHMIDGRLLQVTRQPGRMTLREHTRRHTHRNFFMDWLLMFLMNDTIDKPIRQWDEMFLPTELERNIADLEYTDQAGKIRKLVSESTVFYQAKDVYVVPANAPVHWPVTLITGVILAAILFYVSGFVKQKRRFGRVVFGTILLLFSLCIGFPGLVLFLISSFTDHVVTYWNENLFISNPLTMLLLIPAVQLFLGVHQPAKFTRWLSIVLSGLCMILLLLKFFSRFDQDNALSILLIVPVLLALAYIWLRVIRPNQSANE